MHWLDDPQNWIALVTLTALEIVLGIDNIVFISILAGKLPTLIGPEYTFSFENMNIQRGLLWNQENAVNRGVQVNYNSEHIAISASWNDGSMTIRSSSKTERRSMFSATDCVVWRSSSPAIFSSPFTSVPRV